LDKQAFAGALIELTQETPTNSSSGAITFQAWEPQSADLSIPSNSPRVNFIFRERAAIFDHTVQGALSPPKTSRAPGSATQDHDRALDSNAAKGNTQDMRATLENLFRKECQGCSEAKRPSIIDKYVSINGLSNGNYLFSFNRKPIAQSILV
jgi:hypothetical protein